MGSKMLRVGVAGVRDVRGEAGAGHEVWLWMACCLFMGAWAPPVTSGRAVQKDTAMRIECVLLQ